jgi:hypothetical protein
MGLPRVYIDDEDEPSSRPELEESQLCDDDRLLAEERSDEEISSAEDESSREDGDDDRSYDDEEEKSEIDDRSDELLTSQAWDDDELKLAEGTGVLSKTGNDSGSHRAGNEQSRRGRDELDHTDLREG